MYSKLRNTNEVVVNALRFVRKQIENGQNYFNTSYKEIADFIAYYKKDSGHNREHFANALLISVVSILGGRFKIIKSGNCFVSQGACWLMNCNEVQKLMHNEQEIHKVCNVHCNYKCKIVIH